MTRFLEAEAMLGGIAEFQESSRELRLAQSAQDASLKYSLRTIINTDGKVV